VAFTTNKRLRIGDRAAAIFLDTQQSLAWPDTIRAAPEHHLEKTDAHDPAA
jgi:hypothetical protein